MACQVRDSVRLPPAPVRDDRVSCLERSEGARAPTSGAPAACKQVSGKHDLQTADGISGRNLSGVQSAADCSQQTFSNATEAPTTRTASTPMASPERGRARIHPCEVVGSNPAGRSAPYDDAEGSGGFARPTSLFLPRSDGADTQPRRATLTDEPQSVTRPDEPGRPLHGEILMPVLALLLTVALVVGGLAR